MIVSYEFKGYLADVGWALNWKLDCVGELLFGLPDLFSRLLQPALSTES